MASGMNTRGTESRCFGYLKDFKTCLADFRSMDTSQVKLEDARVLAKQCSDSREDYFECLHGRKSVARIKAVLEEEARQKSGAAAH